MACTAPGLDHVHWAARPAARYTLAWVNVADAVGRIESEHDTRLAPLGSVLICRPPAPAGAGAGVVTETQALEEMLTDLEEDADPATAALRDELISRLAHLAA